MRLIQFITVSLLCWVQLCFGWEATGHMIIATIAYNQLTPAVKQKVDNLSAVLATDYPDTPDFITASTWADYIRQHDVAVFNRWHYIDIPDNTPVPFLPAAPHVVWAIVQTKAILQSPNTHRLEKAIALRFLCHCVGDAHQPLHAITHFSPEHPRGDLGGTLFELSDGISLHTLWDNGLGLFKKYKLPLKNSDREEIDQLAAVIMHEYPADYFINQLYETDPKPWVIESFNIARTYVYTSIAEHTSPSSFYINRGQLITEQQLALAGYRLGLLLNQTLDNKVLPHRPAKH
jgi:hypothetical protein